MVQRTNAAQSFSCTLLFPQEISELTHDSALWQAISVTFQLAESALFLRLCTLLTYPFRNIEAAQ